MRIRRRPPAGLLRQGRELVVTIQVDNGKIYLAKYAGPATAAGAREFVEAHEFINTFYFRDPKKPVENKILDLSWEDFKELIKLGNELVHRVDG